MARVDASPNHFDETLSFGREPNKLAFAYWASCCRGRTMPSRANLNPTQMKKFSPHIGLVEIKDQPGAAPPYFIRRAGSRWEDVYGPMTGKYIGEFMPPPIAAQWVEAFDRVRENKIPLRLTARIDFKNKRWLEAEIFIAPLGEEYVNMLLTCFVSWASPTPSIDGPIFRAAQ